MRAPSKNAKDLIRSTGERITAARVQILALLLAAPRALTHREIEEELDPSLGIDRVTVYRVLEWLTEQHLAHKISSDDRVWRFNAVPAAARPAAMPTSCARLRRGDLPAEMPTECRCRDCRGYLPEALEVTIKGLCRECSPRRGGVPMRRQEPRPQPSRTP